MNKFLLISLLFIFCGIKLVKSQQLSDESSISLITVASGEDLYSVFGHSALRVSDPANKIDWVYNYGTFDFDTPFFYLKFANGNLNYMLAINEYKYFIPYYNKEKRSVTEQLLNLTQSEKQRLFNNLMTNSLPSNKYYRYDFFFDNCATRLRDQVFNAIEGKVVLDTNNYSNLTYRQLYGSYLNHSPWIEFGIHILLGMKSDEKCSSYNEMYLPDYLFKQFSSASIKRLNNTEPLVSKSSKVLEFNNLNIKPSALTPQNIFWFLAFFVILVSIKWSNSNLFFRFIDRLLFLAVGLVGLLLIFLWFISRHDVTSLNFNLLWASPLYLLVIFNLNPKRIKKTFTKAVLSLIILCQLILLVGWYVIPQEFPNGLYPLILILTTRSLLNLKNSILKVKNLK
jgi:hypothetical protein